jgi:hypothetical protein
LKQNDHGWGGFAMFSFSHSSASKLGERYTGHQRRWSEAQKCELPRGPLRMAQFRVMRGVAN